MRIARFRSSIAVVAVTALAVVGLNAAPAVADNVTISSNALRTGWDQNEAGLAPSSVSASDFGQLFATQLDGQIYAQPIVAKSTVLTVTENDKIYGLDPVNGAIKWQRDVGPYWPASNIGCGDLVPNIGITGTPAYDASTGTAYFTAKVNDGPDGNNPHWYLHAIDITTGAERANFPTTIGGHPSNNPSNTFNPKTAMQRPGLLLLDGVVYAGFASHCDYGPFVGYVAGFNASSGKQTTLWSTESGSSDALGGIWQAGGGLVSDGPGRIIVSTGNGSSPAPGPGKTPPGNLAESVIRLQVGSDGNLTAKDFFSPYNNTNLDRDDTDFGSGGPMAIPDGYGTSAHPHLLVQIGKDGRVYLLDRDDLGGTAQGPNGGDAVLQSGGPFNGVWGHPAFWGGDGGYVYSITNKGPLYAYKVGVAGNGLPALSKVGQSTSNWGYTSGSPVVTSNGSASGSALVWGVYTDYEKGASGVNGELRAYDALPTNGIMNLRYSAPIGTASKFVTPATDNGRVYTGTRDGKLFGFGRPTTAALSAQPTDFGNVAVNGSATKNVTVTATRTVTVTGVSTAAPFKTGSVALPKTLTTGQTLSVPVTFSPTTTGSQSGALNFATDAGNLGFDVRGAGTRNGLAGNPASLAFGEVPTTGKVTQNISVTNTGSTTTTITGATGPSAPFSAGSLPGNGTTLAAGASVSVPITFAPTAAGSFSSALQVSSSTGNVSVPVTGTGIVGAPKLTITPTTVDFGSVPVGGTGSASFTIANTGNTVLTLSKAAPPAAPFDVASPVSEGQQIVPGDSIVQKITFKPTATGTATGTYIITGNDGQGAQNIKVTGVGIAANTSGTVPPPSAGGWKANGSATQNGGTTTLTTATPNLAGDVVYPTAVSTTGLRAKFTAQISGGNGADGMTFSLLDASKNTSTSLGKSGGALGYGGLSGVAVTLDTYQNGNDPSANFVGVATGSTGELNDTLTYAGTANVAASLQSGTHAVDVQVTATGLSVGIDGGTPLVVKATVPAKALLAFTAGTGGQTNVHAVSNVNITTGSPSGPVVGLANKCLDVAAGAVADGTAVQLYGCNATAAQAWTIPGDKTLRALGKCLDVAGSGKANFTKVQLYTCNGTGAQQWTTGANNRLVNPNSGRCLDVSGNNSADGTKVIIYDCNGGANQSWKLPGGATST